MKSRERLTRLFQGKEIDRIPIWLLSPFHKIQWYPDIYSIPEYAPLIPYIDAYCDTFNRRYYSRAFCYSASEKIHLSEEKTQLDDGFKMTNTISCGALSLSKSYVRTSKGSTLTSYVKTIDDLDIVLQMPFEPLQPDVSSYFIEKKELGDKGLMMLDLGDPLEILYHLMSAEDFSIFSLTEYNKILEFTDIMYVRIYDWYKYFLERDVGEVFFIVGAEFAGPPLVSPNKFNELSVRYVKGLVDLVRSYGKWSIVHYHGNLFQILEGLKVVGMDGLHTIEAPPIGNCTLTQARQVLGEQTILIGNLQYDDLQNKSADEIDKAVFDIMQEGKSGKFIISPSAGPYDGKPDKKIIDNYITFIKSAIKYGKI